MKKEEKRGRGGGKDRKRRERRRGKNRKWKATTLQKEEALGPKAWRDETSACLEGTR